MKLWYANKSPFTNHTTTTPHSELPKRFPPLTYVDLPKNRFPPGSQRSAPISLAFPYNAAESRPALDAFSRSETDHEDTVTNGSDGAVHWSLSVCGTTWFHPTVSSIKTPRQNVLVGQCVCNPSYRRPIHDCIFYQGRSKYFSQIQVVVSPNSEAKRAEARSNYKEVWDACSPRKFVMSKDCLRLFWVKNLFRQFSGKQDFWFTTLHVHMESNLRFRASQLRVHVTDRKDNGLLALS